MMQFKCICIRASTGTHVPNERVSIAQRRGNEDQIEEREKKKTYRENTHKKKTADDDSRCEMGMEGGRRVRWARNSVSLQ